MNFQILQWPTHNVTCAMTGILALLIFATLLIFVLSKMKPQKNFAELFLRMKSWWFIFLFFCLWIFGAKAIAILCIAFVSYLALKEYFSLLPVQQFDRRILLWAYLSIPVQYYLIMINWYIMFLLYVPVFLFLILPFRAIIVGVTENYLYRISTVQWGSILNVFAIGHIAYLLNLDISKNPAGGNQGLIIYVVLLTQLNDVFQFCWGKAIGGKKIVPKVSPNKTWAGFLGGALTTTCLSVIVAPYLTPMTTPYAIACGLLMAIGGFVGDVNISALKRDIGVKDSGTVLPGHGGILDRVDSLSFTAPIFFHFMSYFFY